MKSIKIYLPILFFVFTISFAQTKINMQKVDESALSNGESYPVDAGPLLERFNKANGIDLQKLEPIPQQLKKTAWNFSPESKYSWWASDLRTGASPAFYQVPSTCKKVGTNCYVFVEDSLWNAGRVDQNAVDSVQIAFDLKTPSGSINPLKGIYQNDVDTYGTPPNVDGDSKIIILILNIRDGYKPGGGYTAGYFYGYNEGNYTNSNRAEIYYLDGNPLDLKSSGGLKTGMSTTAHEFQHMIQYNYHGMNGTSSQETFFNEGCSLVAEVINGYPLYSQSSYYNVSTNRYMLGWNPNNDPTDVLKDYSRAARFFLYLKEQFYKSDNTFFKKFVQSSRTGVDALNTDVFPNISPTTARRFNDIVVDWWIANYLNDKTVSPGYAKWGYDYPNVPAVTPTTTNVDPNLSYKSDAVYKLGAEYISYISGKNLTANFNTNNKSAIQLRAIETGPAGKRVSLVTPGSNFTEPNFGTDYTNVTFLVCHNDNTDYVQNPNTTPFSYSYSSTGTFENKPTEIAYDTTPMASTVYLLSVSDTVAVSFDGIAGTRLDSIKVALRNTAPIEGGVWRTSSTKFLTTRLAGPFMVSGITTPGVPYPDPWPNWVIYDLRSLSIDATNNFVVGFVIDGVYASSSSPTNRVMHTSMPGTSPYHSYTYLHSPSSGTPGWYYIGDGSNISLWLIRAYVSLPTGVKDVIELMPSSFKLAQNYPNPFNPSTVISYQLPVSGHVSLKVYDMLGREVATLVDEFQQAGNHNSQFSISNLPAGRQGSQLSSGIYFYTIKSGNFVETKKMVLMK